MQYECNDIELMLGCFLVKGEMVMVWFVYDEQLFCIELWGDDVECISVVYLLIGEWLGDFDVMVVYFVKYYVSSVGNIECVIGSIQQEFDEWLEYFYLVGKLFEVQWFKECIFYDLEMFKVLGYCLGIENYLCYIDGCVLGVIFYIMFDYFFDDFIIFIDELYVIVL